MRDWAAVVFLAGMLLAGTMITAYQEIREVRQRFGGQADLRTAAFISSIDKIAHCYKDLGIFP